MAVTRRGDTIYLNDGYSDTVYEVEIATGSYGSDKYRVKARCESDALEMVLDYRLSKGFTHPFATEDEFNRIFGDDSWVNQCIYVDRGYWISSVAFIIRRVDKSPRGSSSARGGTAKRAAPKTNGQRKPAKKPASKSSSANRKTTPAKRNPTARRRC